MPSECEQGLAPAEARILIAEAPATPQKAAAPPSIDLRTRLRRVQAAAERDDRAEFTASLAEARAAVAAYPPGGERDAANDVLRVYEDLERLWDYAFSSPTGSFFDAGAENGALVNMMRRYPDYAKAISESTLKLGDQVIYPSRETRQFLTAEASKRLTRLGVRTPTRITQAPPPPAPAPQTMKPLKKPSKPAPRKPVTKIAKAAVTPPQPRSVAPPPPPSPAPAPAPAPTPAPVPAPPLVTDTTPTAAPSTTTTESASTVAPSDTTTTTTTASPQNVPQSGGRMNLLFAIILIIVGVGILIVLLRASD